MEVRKWEPLPTDAISLAAFRWFANSIENHAIALYATRPEVYHHVEAVLRQTLAQLDGLKRQFGVSQEENGCPDGYVWCHNVCAPSCDGVEAASAETRK
jgi:hypothetical protein